MTTLRGLGIIRPKDMPPVEVILVEEPQPRAPYGIKGVGEIGLVPTAGAVAAALHDLDGEWRTTLPMRRPVMRTHHAWARQRAPPPLLRAGARHAGAAADADDVHRDPRARVVAARPGARPRADPLVGRCSARWRRSRAGTTAIIDHHSSPNAIEGSLDVIAEACAEVGVRVVCCYEVTDRNGLDGAKAGLAENERFLRAGGRGYVGAHACFTLSDETLDAVCGLADDLGAGVHIHVAEADADRAAGGRLAARAQDSWLLAHGVHLDRVLPGTVLHNPRSNLNNAVGYGRPARFPRVALGTDGIGADMQEEARLAFALRRDEDVTAAPEATWAWLDEGAILVPGVATDVVTWSYSPMDPWHLAYSTGVRPCGSRSTARSCSTSTAPPAWTRRRSGRRPPSSPSACSAAWRTSPDATARALPAGRPPDPRRHARTRSCGGAQGFEAVWQAESRLVREATIPLAAFAAVTERIKVGSGVVSMWVRNPAFLAATFSTLDDLAPGRAILGIGAWWDPLAAKVGVSRDRPLRAMREIVTVVRALLAGETVTFDGEFVHLDGVELDYVHQERRPKDVPIVIGATGMQMMQLAGEIADGALLNYLVSPAYNEQALDALAEGRGEGGTRARRHRPAAARRVLDGRRPRRRARRGAAARDAVPRSAAAHHEGVGRAGVAARRDRRGAHLAGDARPGGRGVEARPRRRSCS